jgi:pimeloyl-ACP methyl ester carboxylesterase
MVVVARRTVLPYTQTVLVMAMGAAMNIYRMLSLSLQAVICCGLLLAAIPACSMGSAAQLLAAAGAAPLTVDDVPSLDALARVTSAMHAIDPALPAVDNEDQPLKSAGVELGNPTTATSQPKQLEWVIYASSGYAVGELPLEVALDLAGSSGTVWVGTSDFGRGVWRWQALSGPYTAGMRVQVPHPAQAYRASDGVFFIALAVYDGGKLSFSGAVVGGSFIPTDRINVFHRSGQTFITWPERNDLTGEHYRINRGTEPIVDASSLAQSQMVYEVPEGSGNFYADRYNADNSGTWQARYLERFVVEDMGPQLPAELGLLVLTIQGGDFDVGTSGTAYYGVTIVPDGGTEDTSGLGGYLSSAAVVESLANPQPVEIMRAAGGKAHVYLQYMDVRKWNPTFHAPNPGNQYYGLDPSAPAVAEAVQYAYCYTVGEPSPAAVPPVAVYPVVINMHGWGDNSYGPELLGAQYWDVIELRPVDIGETWYFGFAKQHDYHLDVPVEAGDTICNYTEYRILRMLYDLLHDPVLGPQCDPNRIYIYGHSMGGSGALAFALRYPTLFAAAYASQPMTNYLTDPVWDGDVSRKFGARALNLPVELSVPGLIVPSPYGFNGTGVYDWQDHEANAQARLTDDMVPLGVGHGRLDETVHWPEEGRGIYAALDAGKRCWSGYVDDRDHQWMSFLGCPVPFAPNESLVPFGGLGMVLNESVPGMSNYSRNGSLPPLNAPAAPESYNGALEWSSSWNPWDGPPFEDTGMWSISLRTTDGQDATVDITPRRLQEFSPWPGGVPYMWFNRRVSDNEIVASGIVSTGLADTLLTVTGFQVTPAGNRLEISGPLPP